MSKKYMIVNTTVREPRLDKETGKDLRSAAEKQGYRVQWRDSRDAVRSVSPSSWGANPVIVEELNDALLDFVREGIIEIKPIDDIGDVLKDFSSQPAKKQPGVETKAPEAAAEKPKTRSRRKARATEMSKANPKEVAAEKEEYPGAVNPDGANNFTVTAKSKSKVDVKEKVLADGTSNA